MADHLAAAIPEIAAIDDAHVRAELLASTEANVGQLLRLLAHGARADDASIPPEALQFLRGNVQRGIALPTLLRSYRLGHAWLWERGRKRCSKASMTPASSPPAGPELGVHVRLHRQALRRVVEEFGRERERMMRGVAAAARETVRAIFAGERPTRSGLPAPRLLTCAPATWRCGVEHRSEVAASSALVREAAAAARARRAARRALGSRALRRLVGIVRFACGSMLSSATSRRPDVRRRRSPARAGASRGFRRSHAEALQAGAHPVAGRRRGLRVTTYARVELVSLLASDLPRARAFVAEQLGPLAATAEPAQRLRDTVRRVPRRGRQRTRVASGALHPPEHASPIRVKKAEELLGRRVTDQARSSLASSDMRTPSSPPLGPACSAARTTTRTRFTCRAPRSRRRTSPRLACA
jgi:hypothetical protein